MLRALASLIALAALELSACHSICTGSSVIYLGFGANHLYQYSGSIVIEGQTSSLEGCLNAPRMLGAWEIYCSSYEIRVSGPGLQGVRAVTLTILDVEGRALARDQVVMLDELHGYTTDDGSEQCSRRTAVPLTFPPETTAVAISPPAVDFGPQRVGTTGPYVNLTITNESTRQSGVPQLIVTGEFVIRPLCLAAIPPNGSCTTEVAFAPTSPGPKEGKFTIAASPGGSPSIALTGVGQ